MTNHSAMRLGRHRPTHEQRKKAIPLMRYLTKPLPVAPPAVDNTTGAPIALFGNDIYGDCTFAALANYRAICSVKEEIPFPTTAGDVVSAYLAFTGGRDDGAAETEVLALASNQGVELGGPGPWHLGTWTSVPLSNIETCKSLIALFWSLYIGVELPISAQYQDVWSTPRKLSGDDAPMSWGGHALLWSNYTAEHAGLVTWGDNKLADYGWMNEYCDEAYVLLDADRASMIGVEWDALCADLAAITPGSP